MEPKPSGRTSRVTVGLLASLVVLAALIAFISVLVGVTYGLGLPRAILVFVGYAVVIAAAIYTWNRFANKLR